MPFGLVCPWKPGSDPTRQHRSINRGAQAERIAAARDERLCQVLRRGALRDYIRANAQLELPRPSRRGGPRDDEAGAQANHHHVVRQLPHRGSFQRAPGAFPGEIHGPGSFAKVRPLRELHRPKGLRICQIYLARGTFDQMKRVAQEWGGSGRKREKRPTPRWRQGDGASAGGEQIRMPRWKGKHTNTGVSHIEANDWAAFSDWVQLLADVEHWVFRGQADENWRLESRLSRLFRKAKVEDPKERTRLAGEHLERFKKATLQVGAGPTPKET